MAPIPWQIGNLHNFSGCYIRRWHTMKQASLVAVFNRVPMRYHNAACFLAHLRHLRLEHDLPMSLNAPTHNASRNNISCHKQHKPSVTKPIFQATVLTVPLWIGSPPPSPHNTTPLLPTPPGNPNTILDPKAMIKYDNTGQVHAPRASQLLLYSHDPNLPCTDPCK
jgi:hypothetical protein